MNDIIVSDDSKMKRLLSYSMKINKTTKKTIPNKEGIEKGPAKAELKKAL